jgi:hypothetical protein
MRLKDLIYELELFPNRDLPVYVLDAQQEHQEVETISTDGTRVLIQ